MTPVTITGTGSLPACTFTRSGFAFTGWNTDSNGSGTSYSDKGYCSPKSDITLYAQWGTPVATVTTATGATSDHATLAAALAAAPGGSTIQLKGNSTVPEQGLTITKDMTLDLNGYDITSAFSYGSLLWVGT